MRIGIIDLGSNSVRFDLYQIYQDKIIEKIYTEKLMIRLGHDAFSLNKFSSITIKNCVKTFQHFKNIAEHYNIETIHAFATAAVRHSKNSSQLIDAVIKKTNIKIKILSGKDEARYIYKSIAQNIAKYQKNFLCIDIGGGSTEISLNDGHEVFHTSIALGSSLIKEYFLSKHLQQSQALEHLEIEINKQLHKHLSSWPKGHVNLAYGSSGTVKGIVRVLAKNNLEAPMCSLDGLNNLHKMTKDLSRQDLLKVPFLEEKRADMFVGGNLLLKKILDYFNCTHFQYSPIALKEGLLKNVSEKIKPIQTSDLIKLTKKTVFLKNNPIVTNKLSNYKKQIKCLSQLAIHQEALELIKLSLFLLLPCSNFTLYPSEATCIINRYPFFSDKKEKDKTSDLLFMLNYIDDSHKLHGSYLSYACILLMHWFNQNLSPLKIRYKINKGLLIVNSKRIQLSFLQEKQLEQIKKPFEELFDLKIKLL